MSAGPVPSGPLVALRGITKTFGAINACDGVDLELSRGQVHGILGENGAGKSTLMNIMIGLVVPDEGTITVDGKRCTIASPSHAAGLGIAMVHQHLSLVDAMTVWENVALGDTGRLDPASIRERVAEIGDQYGLRIDPYAKVGDLPGGLRQRVEIIKCLRRDPSVLLFDEPTSLLTPEESDQLFETLRRVVANEGRSVALVSHKLDEVLTASDTITIMRAGKVVSRLATRDADRAGLAHQMIGRAVTVHGPITQPAAPPDHRLPPVLEVSGASVGGRGDSPSLDGLSLSVGEGELVGVAGVEGNGQGALSDLLSSLLPLDHGRVVVAGADVAAGVPGAMANAGVGVIPADRHDSGLVMEMSLAENLAVVDPRSLARRGVIDPGRLRAHAEQLIAEFEIQCSGPDAAMWTLSGGHQQRVVLARELSHQPRVLVAVQPTRGLDVGAVDYITQRLRRVAADGAGVLLISSDLDEILDLAHRIIVLYRGRIIGEMNRHGLDRGRLGSLIGGQVS